jgi:hypothetical protein
MEKMVFGQQRKKGKSCRKLSSKKSILIKFIPITLLSSLHFGEQSPAVSGKILKNVNYNIYIILGHRGMFSLGFWKKLNERREEEWFVATGMM